MTVVPQTTPTTPTTPTAEEMRPDDSPRLAALREQARAAQDRFEAAQQALAAQRQLVTAAQTAQQQRAQLIAEARQAAQDAATASIAAGSGDTSEAENRAAFAQWRQEQELARAQAAVASVAAQVAPLEQAVRETGAEWGRITTLIAAEERTLEAEALRAEWEAYAATGADLARRSRDLNNRARAAGGPRNIIVPGAEVPAIRAGSEFSAAQLGIRLTLAPDLIRPDVAESTVRGGNVG